MKMASALAKSSSAESVMASAACRKPPGEETLKCLKK
jgi:hypothetical protein